ncbi:MAG: Rieske 2Fe-2S domain-containing protein [Cyanobacteria bacterium]|jgi:phenylpropionate dioxygenase-like ring-hydroxylating dioxygenase large terminal subunit|nr:Rieske 2Fe-2S domain-containing protein [Cyanobacteria bacterium GSL.Bin1]
MEDVRHCRLNLNHWLPVTQKRNFPDSGLQPIQVGGRELVVFKAEREGFSIFEDACPHRRVRLSQLGRKEKNTLVCTYHGWQFDGDNGACQATPGQPELKKKFCLKSYPVQEYGDWVWGFFGEPQLAEQVALPRMKALEGSQNYLTVSLEQTAQCHFSYLVENALDLFHAELHRNPKPVSDPSLGNWQGLELFLSSLMENLFQWLDRDRTGNLQPWSDAKLIQCQRDEQSLQAVYKVTVTPFLRFLGESQGQLRTRLVYEYPYIYQESEDGKVVIFSVFVPVGEQKTQIYSTFSFQHFWAVPGLTELLQFNLKRGFQQIVAQDIQAVEEEQRAYNRQGRDCTREPNPVAHAARQVILQQDTKGASPV